MFKPILVGAWRAFLCIACGLFMGCGVELEPQEAAADTPVKTETAAQELSSYSLVTSSSVYLPGSTITVYWQAPPSHGSTDWVGMYTPAASNTSYGQWKYVPPGSFGTMIFTAPSTEGIYEFRYLLNNGYTSVAVSNQFVVDVPHICRALRSGDPYHPSWIHCCDSADQSQSYWTRSDNYANWYSGSCWSWGIRP